MGEIVSIHIVRKSKAPVESCNKVKVCMNYGIVGDYRSGKYQIGQITLIEEESMDLASRKLGYEIPNGASRRQIMVMGISLNELIGYKLRIGSVLVRVEDKCKPCNNMEVMIGSGAKDAMDGQGGVRCRVIKGGELHISDIVTVEGYGCPFYTKLSSLYFKFICYFIRFFKKK